MYIHNIFSGLWLELGLGLGLGLWLGLGLGLGLGVRLGLGLGLGFGLRLGGVDSICSYISRGVYTYCILRFMVRVKAIVRV